MSVIGGIVGGVIGGSFALTAGWLADWRTRRNSVVTEILDEGARLVAASRALASLVLEARVARFDDGQEDARLDLGRLLPLEQQFTQAYVRMSWRVRKSPLWNPMVDLDEQRRRLVGPWGETKEVWEPRYVEYERRLAMVDDILQVVADMPPWQAAWYVQSVNLPTPNPVSAGQTEPPPWHRRVMKRLKRRRERAAVRRARRTAQRSR